MIKKQFDALITNPPFSDSSHTEGKNSLWRKWFEFDELVKDNGVIAEVIPSSWMGSPPIIKEHFISNDKLSKNVTFINRDECERHFKGIGSKFSYLVYTKGDYNEHTNLTVKNFDNSISHFSENLNDVIFDVFPRDLTKTGISILNKTLKNRELLGIVNTTVCHGNNKDRWRDKRDSEFKYPIEKTPNKLIFYNRKHPHQNLPKIVIPTTTYYRSMYFTTNGTSQSFCYYVMDSGEDNDIVLNNINNKLFDYINECFRYSNWNSVSILRKLPKIPLDKKMTDGDLFDFFDLSSTEIEHINKIITWR